MKNQSPPSEPASPESASPEEPTTRRTAAACRRCGAVYAAEVCSSGTIMPIGNRAGCRCGGTQFEELEPPSQASNGSFDAEPTD